MKLHHLKPAPGSRRDRTRVGRGEGGHGGKTAGRGTKGSKARTNMPRWFEGGQMPLDRRLRVRAYITNRRQRLVQARAELLDDAGTLLAEGEGAFLRVTPEKGRELAELYRAPEASP